MYVVYNTFPFNSFGNRIPEISDPDSIACRRLQINRVNSSFRPIIQKSFFNFCRRLLLNLLIVFWLYLLVTTLGLPRLYAIDLINFQDRTLLSGRFTGGCAAIFPARWRGVDHGQHRPFSRLAYPTHPIFSAISFIFSDFGSLFCNAVLKNGHYLWGSLVRGLGWLVLYGRAKSARIGSYSFTNAEFWTCSLSWQRCLFGWKAIRGSLGQRRPDTGPFRRHRLPDCRFRNRWFSDCDIFWFLSRWRLHGFYCSYKFN